jgi:hypothetical protein
VFEKRRCLRSEFIAKSGVVHGMLSGLIFALSQDGVYHPQLAEYCRELEVCSALRRSATTEEDGSGNGTSGSRSGDE